MTSLVRSLARLEPTSIVFALVLARLVGLMLIAPIFGSRLVPARARAAVAVFLAWALLGAVPPAAEESAGSLADPLRMVVALGAETAVGFLLGLAAQFVFAGVQMAGQLAGIQMGVGLANLIDPQSQERVTSLAQWMNLSALFLFLTLDGHHLLVRAVAESFRLLPIGVASIGPAGLGVVFTLAGGIFVVALKLASPVLVLILMINGALGVLTKMIPQLNVMIVGFGLNVAAGFFVLAASQPFMLRIVESSFGGLLSLLVRLARALG